MFEKRKHLMTVFLVGLVLLIVALGFWKKQEGKPPFIVDGKPVLREELEFYNGNKERAVRGKVIWNWAEQEGFVNEFSYDAFLKALEEENKKRKESDEKGEPVYGPIEFTPMQYYKRLIGECEQALKVKKMK